MAKFGKLELTDDSDEDTEEVRVVTKRKRAVETIIISSDEEECDNSSDLSSLPPSPAPVRRPVLKGDNGSSRERTTAEKPQATGSLFGSTSGSTLSGTSSGDDEDVTILETTPQKPASIRGTPKPAFQADRSEGDSDGDCVYEIPIPAQARTVQANANNSKQMSYNKPLGNLSGQSSTILAASVQPNKPLVHNPPTASSPRTDVPQSGSPPTVKPSQMPLNKQAPRRLLKDTKRSTDTMSWNPSERIHPILARPLNPQKPVPTPHNAHAAVTSPTKARTQSTISPSNPFPFANKALVVRLKRPSSPPRSSFSESGPPASGSVAVPGNIAVTALPKSAAMETEEGSVGPTLVPKYRGDIEAGTTTADTSTGSSEENADISPTAPINQDPRAAVDSPMSDQHTYVLTSEYERQLYQAVGQHWPPLARMREQLANAHLTEDMGDDSDIVSASEGDAEHPLEDQWYRGIGREGVCSCQPGGRPCTQPSNCLALREKWRSGRLGMGAGEPGDSTGAHTSGVTSQVQERTHTVEENVSVAMAMRRYAERLWSVASSVPKIWTGTVSSGGSVGVQERRDDVLAQGQDQEGVMEADEDIPPENQDLVEEVPPEGHGLAQDDREGSYELPSPSSNVIKLPLTQPTALPLAPNESTPPIATPTAVVSTAPTLVNGSTTPKKPASTPVALSAPVESVLATSLLPSRVIQPPTIDNVSQSQQSQYPYDFSYDSSAMHISSTPWDSNSFAMIRTTASDSKSAVPPEKSTGIELPVSIMKAYRPTHHFLGVEPPRIRGMKIYARYATRGSSSRELVDATVLFTDVEDLSESEMTPHALQTYLEARYRQEIEADLKPTKETLKRKAVDSESSASEHTPEHEESATVKKNAQRGSRKRRKYSQTPSLLSNSLTPTVQTARRLRVYSGGTSIIVPFGLNVDDIDTSSIEIREVRACTITSLCHQCRCSNTSSAPKAQCGNTTVRYPGPSTRCSKTFCERCLRGWYGLDDDAMEFVKGGQRVTEGKGTGTGIGLGIVEGKWICPVCINLCMCTVCSKKREVERTRYAPSAHAVISEAAGSSVEPTIRSGYSETRRNARPPKPPASESGSRPPSSTPIPPIRLAPKRLAAPPVPVQWLPAIPTPTPGLDPIYYEATRPCTRDFPTGAPQLTAANHAPIVYNAGADIENDGLEDSFTGSEASESEAGGEERVGGQSARSRSKSASPNNHEITANNVVPPTTRKNFLIVTPGLRMPSTMKKKRELVMEPLSPSPPTLTPQLTTLAIPDSSEPKLDSITQPSLKSPITALPDDASPIFDDYPTTIDPTQLSAPLDDNFTPYFSECEMDLNEATETGSPNLAMNYHDFLPILDADMSVTEGFVFPLDNDGDAFMEDGGPSLFLGHSSPRQDPDATSFEYDLLPYIDNSVDESLTDLYVTATPSFANEGDTFVLPGASASATSGVEESTDHSA